MNLVITFDFSTNDFEHATMVCEVAFGFEGEAWEHIKALEDMELLAEFLEANEIFVETMYENS